MLILSRTLASGIRPRLATLLGNVVHAMLTGIGVSTVILLFPAALTALKVTGVAYLLYLVVASWRVPATPKLDGRLSGPVGRPGRFIVQGPINNLSNPKMIAFFLALFPQSVRDTARWRCRASCSA